MAMGFLILMIFVLRRREVMYPIGGLRRERLKQLKWIPPFRTGPNSSDTLFDIVSFMSDPVDRLRTSLHNMLWLNEFIVFPGIEPNGTTQTQRLDFPKARSEFNRNPDEFVLSLEKFSQDLRIKELSGSIFMHCAKPELVKTSIYDGHSIVDMIVIWLFTRSLTTEKLERLRQRRLEQLRQRRLKCWLNLQSQVLKIIERTKPSSTGFGSASSAPNCENALALLQDPVFGETTGASETALNQSREFLGRYISMYHDPEDAGKYTFSAIRVCLHTHHTLVTSNF